MTNDTARLDGIFHALADATRRAILARLVEGPASVSDLARPFAMAMPTLLAHIRVLEGCRLIASQKIGRVRTCRMESKAIESAEVWLAAQRLAFEARFDRMDAHVLDLKAKEHADGRRRKTK